MNDLQKKIKNNYLTYTKQFKSLCVIYYYFSNLHHVINKKESVNVFNLKKKDLFNKNPLKHREGITNVKKKFNYDKFNKIIK